MFSSNRSGESGSRNSTATPPWKQRTTLPGVRPSVTLVPIGRASLIATAAPERETSIRRVSMARPFASSRTTAGRRGTTRWGGGFPGRAGGGPVGEPGELGRQLVPLARRRDDRHREPVLDVPGDVAL